ncbi:uncharacterized mitochondrial protein AtMg00860-like [Beta vulgaris subsp. vulgaris]|uniref:uncharacterized mitochondrial protein AtMg00860-like n=1 Tax=Beta vulgaris subsp. vulgaris TaxID=3555 RepID=UPI0020371879|nr:uncharacterized mitochondrial protein AtMg00860-like [Beta vulgaris subsp. vulgaris]
MEKCEFFTPSVSTLGFIISKDGIAMDEAKVEAIKPWPTRKNVTEVRCFHGLASLYRRFIKDFSTLLAPLTECIKKESFTWTPATQGAFKALKNKLSEAPILAIPDLNQVFEVECDASGVGIEAVLTQGVRRTAYFSEKLNNSRINYITYDKESYAMV